MYVGGYNDEECPLKGLPATNITTENHKLTSNDFIHGSTKSFSSYIYHSPGSEFSFLPLASLEGLLLFACPFWFFVVNVSLLATDVRRCWSSSQAGFFFFGSADDDVKNLRKELVFGFRSLSVSLSCWYPLLLMPEDEAGVALLLLFALLLRKPPKKGILNGRLSLGYSLIRKDTEWLVHYKDNWREWQRIIFIGVALAEATTTDWRPLCAKRSARDSFNRFG